MTHWSEYLTFAVLHMEAMKYTQIAVDPMAMMAAMQEAQRQAQQFNSVMPTRFDPRLISAR